MHRVELKVMGLPSSMPLISYLFLMHRVELKGKMAVLNPILDILFLMHRVELKVVSGQGGGYRTSSSPCS
jgi:hypothetical protein